MSLCSEIVVRALILRCANLENEVISSPDFCIKLLFCVFSHILIYNINRIRHECMCMNVTFVIITILFCLKKERKKEEKKANIRKKERKRNWSDTYVSMK